MFEYLPKRQSAKPGIVTKHIDCNLRWALTGRKFSLQSLLQQSNRGRQRIHRQNQSPDSEMFSVGDQLSLGLSSLVAVQSTLRANANYSGGRRPNAGPGARVILSSPGPP